MDREGGIEEMQTFKEIENNQNNQNDNIKSEIDETEFWTSERLDRFFKNIFKYKAQRDWFGLARRIDPDVSAIDVYHYCLVMDDAIESLGLSRESSIEDLNSEDEEMSEQDLEEEEIKEENFLDEEEIEEMKNLNKFDKEEDGEEGEEMNHIIRHFELRKRLSKDISFLAKKQTENLLEEWIRKVIIKCIEINEEAKLDPKTAHEMLTINVIETALRSFDKVK